jgi:hypothetical protein
MTGFFKNLFTPHGADAAAEPQECRVADNAKPVQVIPISPMCIEEKNASPVAVIYQSELDYISRCVLDYPDIETGGDLFGFWTNEGIPVVLYAIGPGRNANHQDAFFVQDVGYFEAVARALGGKYQLSHMGEWHSHHQLGLARPSGHDARTIFKGIREVPLRHMLLCIANYRDGKTTVNPFTFHENDMLHYVDASWRILPVESPFRKLIDQDLSTVLIHPQTPQPSHGKMRLFGAGRPAQYRKETDRLKDSHWLRRPGGVDLLRKMMELWKDQDPEEIISPQWDESGNIFLTKGDATVEYSPLFPDAPPTLSIKNVPVSEAVPWNYTSVDSDIKQDDRNILTAFKQWIAGAELMSNHIKTNNTSHDDKQEIL